MFSIHYTKIALIALCFLCIIPACRKKEGVDIGDREFMVKLIMDMHVAEAAMSKVPEKYKDSLRLEYRGVIAQMHSMQTWELDSILLQVQEDPDRYKSLTTEAMQRLDSLERSLH